MYFFKKITRKMKNFGIYYIYRRFFGVGRYADFFIAEFG